LSGSPCPSEEAGVEEDSRISGDGEPGEQTRYPSVYLPTTAHTSANHTTVSLKTSQKDIIFLYSVRPQSSDRDYRITVLRKVWKLF